MSAISTDAVLIEVPFAGYRLFRKSLPAKLRLFEIVRTSKTKPIKCPVNCVFFGGFRAICARVLRISAGLGLRIFRASGFPGLRAIRMLRITAGLRRRVFRISGFREIRILRISAALWLMVSRRTHIVG